MDAQCKAITVIAVLMITSALFIGAGYAFDYFGTTSSSPQTVDVKYVVVEIDGNTSGSLTDTFHFSGPKYFTDTHIPGVTKYRTVDYSEASQAASVIVNGANTISVTMKVNLTQALPAGAIVKLQFYNSDQSVTVGPQVTLTTAESTVTTLTCGTIYYCKVTVDIAGQTDLNSPPSSFDLDVTFMAFAEA